MTPKPRPIACRHRWSPTRSQAGTLLLVAALLVSPAAAHAGGPGMDHVPVVDLSGAVGGTGAIGPTGALDARLTHWFGPSLGLGIEVAGVSAGAGGDYTPGDSLLQGGAALALSLRHASPRADVVLVVAAGLAHTSATHYAAAPEVAPPASQGSDCYDGPYVGAGGCVLLGALGDLGGSPPLPSPTIPTFAEYIAPSLSVSGHLVFHTWAHAGITLGVRVAMMALGSHALPEGGASANLLATVGLAFFPGG